MKCIEFIHHHKYSIPLHGHILRILINTIIIITWSTSLREINETEQNCGPGPVLSTIATSGRLCLKRSWRNGSLGSGVGKRRNVRTDPCDHDSTSLASPVAGAHQTYKTISQKINKIHNFISDLQIMYRSYS